MGMTMLGTTYRGGQRDRRSRIASGGAVGIPVAIAVGMAIYVLSQPHALLGVDGVDDGVYFGAAVRFVHGVLPYRDFVLLHPPGIATILAPVALLSDLVGTRVGLGIARVLTEAVAVANVALVWGMLRRYGNWAAGIGAVVLAIFPLGVAATNTLTLEPYFVLCCLVGASIALSDLAHRPAWLAVAGAWFALGVDVKVWAVVPFAVALCTLVSARLRGLGAFLGGFCVALAVLIGPFVAAAPSAFVHDVVRTQYDRATATVGPSLSTRLLDLTGVTGFLSSGGTERAAEVVAVVLGVVALGALVVGRRRIGRMEVFAFGAWVAMTLAVLATAEFYEYYTYAASAFGALALGCAVGLCYRPPRRSVRIVAPRPRPWIVAVLVLLVAAGVAYVTAGDVRFARAFVAASEPFDPARAIDAVIPKGACVVSDQTSLLIDANRMVPEASGCPAVVDPFGTWLAADPENPPPSIGPYAPALVAEWQGWLARADDLLLEFPIPRSSDIPAAPSIEKAFTSTYRLTYESFGASVYRNAAHP